MDINGVPVGLSDAERRERAAALRRTQEEKERKMRELHMEFKADRTIPRTIVHTAASAREQQAQHEEASASGEDAAVGGAARPLQPLLPAAGFTPSVAGVQGNRAAALAAAEARAAAAAAAGPVASTAPAAATKRTRIVEPPRSPQRPEFQQGGISEEERKRRAEEIKRQQAERERARQRIASEFRSDHNIGTSSESASDRGGASSAQTSHGSSAVISQACMVQLRLPGGEVTKKEFQASDLLSLVVDWAQLVLRQHGIYESCKLVLPPHQVLGENDASKTLCELQFLPRVSFNLQLQSASGVVTQAPRAGSEFESAFVVELTAMLESDGFTSWEAQEWGMLVHSQLRRGEMRRVRANIRALFGGLRLPNTIKAWAARVDQAPRMPEPAKALDPAGRFRQEVGDWSASDREQLGFSMLPLPHPAQEEPGRQLPPVPAPRICRLTMSKIAPASGLARDLAELGRNTSLSQELVLECHFGADFPFEAPAVRVLYPVLTNIPLAPGVDAHSKNEDGGRAGEDEACEPARVAVGMALQANAEALALAGAKCSLWSVNMGQSFPRFAGWLRNWIMGSGARVDSELTKRLMHTGEAPSCGGFLPTVGGLWRALRLVVEEDGGAGEGWSVKLPPGLRVEEQVMDIDVSAEGSESGDASMLEAKEGKGCETQEDFGLDEVEEEEDEKDPGVEEMVSRGMWKVEPVHFVELSTRGSWADGGGQMAVGAVTAWDAPEGAVLVSPRVAAALGIRDTMGDSDRHLLVRGVKVMAATSVQFSASGADANTLRYNLPDAIARLAAVKATCYAGQSLLITLDGGRTIEVIVAKVEPVDYSYVSARSTFACL